MAAYGSGKPYSFCSTGDDHAAVCRLQVDVPGEPGKVMVVSVPCTVRVTATGEYRSTGATVGSVRSSVQTTIPDYYGSHHTKVLTLEEADAIAQGAGTSLDEMIGASLGAQQAATDRANLIIKEKKEQGLLDDPTADFSLNRFLRDTNALRVLRWSRR
jgi:hypothetical protein